MSEKSINTLLELLEVYKIEVPIVQRDYAQGRLDEHSSMVRKNLLEDMKIAVFNKDCPLDLNFVYGKAEGNKFIPIDGQQRLTTLFLLHLYAFWNDESKNDTLMKFTYETRTTSRSFFEKLVEKRNSIFSSKLCPSEEIEDSEWFVSGWSYDPTIKSVMTMLDEIVTVFDDKDNLAVKLTDDSYLPIVFKFLEMKELGMEDSLYIKLNARGKPLTDFENFKARLVGRIESLNLDFKNEFEILFDGAWTDLFWSTHTDSFDQSFLTFFGVLLMNRGILNNDTKWADRLDFDKIDTEVFQTALYTLNFLCSSSNNDIARKFTFDALTERRTYPNRVLFHAVSIYMYKSKGVDSGSLFQWLRIIQNLTLNSQIDDATTYRRAIEGINVLAEHWNDILNYFSQNGKMSGFSGDQIKEEQQKALIISQDSIFADKIYNAEKHPYFSGQIRCALNYAIKGDKNFDVTTFSEYWDKISALFDDSKAKHGNLLRQALLTFGNYTLSVSSYHTLCVNDPNEGLRTWSFKTLFSRNSRYVKQLLDSLKVGSDISVQLEEIVSNANIPTNDWRYCFISYPRLFDKMSPNHFRLRFLNGEVIMIPNQSSSGYNYDVFLTALHEDLNEKGLTSTFDGYLGTWVKRYLYVEGLWVRFNDGKFFIEDAEGNAIFSTKTENPIKEALDYLLSYCPNSNC